MGRQNADQVSQDFRCKRGGEKLSGGILPPSNSRARTTAPEQTAYRVRQQPAAGSRQTPADTWHYFPPGLRACRTSRASVGAPAD
jgi:hypothetical protein